jgi:formyl-CoA transferase
MKIGVPMIDIMTSMQALAGIQAALLHRERTGKGTKISTSLLESALASMTNVISDYVNEGIVPQRWGNGHPNLAPYAAYQASDGWLTVGVATEGQWAKFCTVIGRPELATDPRFATNQDRLGHRRLLDEVVAPAIAATTKQGCLEALQAAGVPCAPLNTVPEIIADPHVQAIGMVQELPHPSLGRVKMVRPAISVEDAPIALERPPPTFAQHTDEILGGLLCLEKAAIGALREAGAVS